MHIPAGGCLQEEVQEEEGGIFDTIAGTPSEDEQGSAAEDDEWLGEDSADMDVSGGAYAVQDEEGDESESDLQG